MGQRVNKGDAALKSFVAFAETLTTAVAGASGVRRTKAVHIWIELTDDAFLAFADALTEDADDLAYQLEQLVSERLGRVYPDVSVEVDRHRVKHRALESWGRQFLERLHGEAE